MELYRLLYEYIPGVRKVHNPLLENTYRRKKKWLGQKILFVKSNGDLDHDLDLHLEGFEKSFLV